MKKKKPAPPGYGTNTPGRRRHFGEPTTTIAFRVPESKVPEIKKIVNNQLDKYRHDISTDMTHEDKARYAASRNPSGLPYIAFFPLKNVTLRPNVAGRYRKYTPGEYRTLLNNLTLF